MSNQFRRPKAPKKTTQSSRRNESIKVTSEVAKIAKSQAQKIYLSMVENGATPQSFIEQARYIDPAVYDDITADRAIVGMCGYPLCSKEFTDTFGERSYIIRSNKLYDITKRRNFCSNVCFEASEIVCNQLATDPLYLRYSENAVIKDVKIPVMEHLQGLYGKLVDVTGGMLNLDVEEKQRKKKKSFTSVNEIAHETLVTCSENKENNEESKTGDENHEKDVNVKEHSQDAETVEYNLENERDVTERKINKEDKAAEIEDPHVAVHVVERALREWMSFDSLRVVLGDKCVRGMLEHIGRTWDDYDTTSGLRLGVEAKAKYIAICRKLDHEEREDNAELQSTDLEDAKLLPKLPLPDYQQLQRDAKNQQLKVVSFLEGSDQYEEPEFSQQDEMRGSLDTIMEEEGSSVICSNKGGSTQRSAHTNHKKAKSKKINEELDTASSTLPFIDSYSQIAWRRHIVEEKTSTFLQQILEATDLDGREVRRLLKTVVMTFDLSPHNISFRPGQWRLVTIILLKMLTVRYPIIFEALKGEQAVNIQKTVLSGFNLDYFYCDRILSYLTEVYYIISKNFVNEDIHIQQNDKAENIKSSPNPRASQLSNVKRQAATTDNLQEKLENLSYKEETSTNSEELD